MRYTPANWPRYVFVSVSVLALLLLVIHLAVGGLLRWQLEENLHPEPGRGTYLGDVRVNLFSGLLHIEGLHLGPDGARYLEVGSLLVDVDMHALLGGDIIIEQFDMASPRWWVSRDAQGQMHPGLPLPVDQTEPSTADSAPLAVQIQRAQVRNGQIFYRDEIVAEQPTVLRIKQLRLDDFDTRASDPAAWLLELVWDASRVHVSGQLAMQPALQVDADISIEQLPVEQVLAYARQDLALQARVDSRWQVQYSPARLQAKGNLEIADAAFKQAAQQATLAALSVQDIEAELGLDESGTATFAVLGLDARQVAWRQDDQQIRLAKLALQSTNGDAVLSGTAEQAQLRGDLALVGFTWQAADQQAQVQQLAMQALKGQVGYAAPEQLELGAQQLSWQGLQWQDASQRLQPGDGSLKGQWHYQADTLRQAGLALRVKDSLLKLEQAEVQLGALQLNTRAGDLVLAKPRIRGDLKLAPVSVHMTGEQPQSVRIKATKLAEWAWLEGELQLKGVQLDQLAGSLPKTEIGQLKLDSLSWQPEAIALGQLALRDVSALIERDAQGAWQLPGGSNSGADRTNAHAAHSEASSKAPAAKSETSDEQASMKFVLAGMQWSGNNRIALRDASITPPLEQNWLIEELSMGALDSRKPNQATALTLRLKPDDFAELKIEGKLQPLAASLRLDLKGELQNLALAPLDGVLAKDLGHHFLDGHVDNTFSLEITDQKLNMSNELAILRLEAEPIEGAEGPPLGLAVALLEDRDGKIALKAPISGDLNNPKFSVLGAVGPVITKAIAGTATLALQPAGSVLLLGSLLTNQALKVSFSPTIFTAREASLSEAARKDLDALFGKLQEKPRMKLRLCGRAVDADRTRDKKGKVVESDEQLLALADQRADAVRAYLQGKGIEVTRLRACRAQIDEDGTAKPKVEISL